VRIEKALHDIDRNCGIHSEVTFRKNKDVWWGFVRDSNGKFKADAFGTTLAECAVELDNRWREKL